MHIQTETIPGIAVIAGITFEKKSCCIAIGILFWLVKIEIYGR